MYSKIETLDDVLKLLENQTLGTKLLDTAIIRAGLGMPQMLWPKDQELARHAPSYTSSLDMAMLLVPDHSHVALHTVHEGIVGGHATIFVTWPPMMARVTIEAISLSTHQFRRTLPMALCIAAVKAHIELLKSPYSNRIFGTGSIA